LFPQKFLSVQFLLLLDFAAYQYKKKLVISFGSCSKYISSIKKRKKKKEKKSRSKRYLLVSAAEN
jgi:hypothetical protein